MRIIAVPPPYAAAAAPVTLNFIGLKNQYGMIIPGEIDNTSRSSAYLYNCVHLCQGLFDLHAKLRLVPLVNTPFPQGFRHTHLHSRLTNVTKPFVQTSYEQT